MCSKRAFNASYNALTKSSGYKVIVSQRLEHIGQQTYVNHKVERDVLLEILAIKMCSHVLSVRVICL